MYNDKFKLLKASPLKEPEQPKDSVIITSTVVIPFNDLVAKANNEQLQKLLKAIYAEMAKRGIKE